MFRMMSRSSLPLVLLALSGGCMLGPYDGQVVRDRSTPVDFSGFHVVGGRTVDVLARDRSGTYRRIGGARSSTVAGRTGSDTDLFSWYDPGVVIPPEYWRSGGCSGFYANVRARDPDSDRTFISVERDWGACWEDVEYDVGRFADECASPNSPTATIFTEDYASAPPPAQVTSRRIRGMVYDECDRVQIHFGVEAGRHREIEAAIRSGSRVQHLPCTVDASGNATCTVEFGSGAIAGSWEDFINGGHPVGLEFAHRGLDQSNCSPGRAVWTSWTPWERMDGFGRDVSSSRTCFEGGPTEPPPPPEPEPDDEGTWWDITCICADVTATAVVEVDGCLQEGVTYPTAGASLMCGYAENAVESRTGLQTTCVLEALSNTGNGPCDPGAWFVESIEVPED